jgi:hypothetical protein
MPASSGNLRSLQPASEAEAPKPSSEAVPRGGKINIKKAPYTPVGYIDTPNSFRISNRCRENRRK